MTKKSVVITGGTKGIGKCLTDIFMSNGYNVVVGARNIEDISEQNKEKIIFESVDVIHEKSHLQLAKKAIEKTGSIDVWINNVGLSEWKPIDEIDELFFDKLMNVNLKSAFWGCKTAALYMKKKGGSIINISSIAGKRGSANNSMYSATKFGMNGLTQSLAKELGPFGIRVNAICPVLVKTDGLIEALKTKHSPAKTKPEEFLNKFQDENAATGLLPDGNDVAEMALFLANMKNKSITGQCINIDSGVFPQ
jgi:NAD(P)-dependent dehydrogenase (short-subunit alcohol dehydrogenase family)